MPGDLCFTYVTSLFIFFFISPWIFESANGRLVNLLRTVGGIL